MAKRELPYKMKSAKKTRKFGGKVYQLYGYRAMKSEANDLVRDLRNKGNAARVVAHPGYYGGGWDIYARS